MNQEVGNVSLSLDYFKSKVSDKSLSILDIGCSYGTFINSLYSSGFQNCSGLDTTDKFLSEGKNRYPHIAERINWYDGDRILHNGNKYDIITMFDVIEHIPHIGRFLRESVYDNLRPGGKFIFQTPNIYTNIPWCIYKDRSFSKYKKYHCSLQSYSSLKKLLINSGFKDIRIEKSNLISDYNMSNLNRFFPPCVSITMLKALSKLPTRICTNFWGVAIKD